MQSAPAIDLSVIPSAQRAAVPALIETVAARTEITRRQEHLIAELNHALHGKRSEKLTQDERQLACEEPVHRAGRGRDGEGNPCGQSG